MGKTLHLAWQVFGLVDISNHQPTDRRFPTQKNGSVLIDGVGFHLPLRDSPGFAPGSLLPYPTWVHQTLCIPYIVCSTFVNTKYSSTFFNVLVFSFVVDN